MRRAQAPAYFTQAKNTKAADDLVMRGGAMASTALLLTQFLESQHQRVVLTYISVYVITRTHHFKETVHVRKYYYMGKPKHYLFLEAKNYKNLKQSTQCKKISSKIDYEMVSDSLYDFYMEYFKALAFLAVLKLFIANTILEKQQ